ncbi:hypothetical protein [Paludisphaera mucosa]|uniref:Uncharacterized protein n=1 Tax=Paludisphaera mucosa TaxID=3030827 RepID=A0ABT6FGC4_9BACT|nr:hypothetical protein [Paludisphaera mucosa]MDG3006627.1 hypothetical protein [Paludisphaera mucosa]
MIRTRIASGKAPAPGESVLRAALAEYRERRDGGALPSDLAKAGEILYAAIHLARGGVAWESLAEPTAAEIDGALIIVDPDDDITAVRRIHVVESANVIRFRPTVPTSATTPKASRGRRKTTVDA